MLLRHKLRISQTLWGCFIKLLPLCNLSITFQLLGLLFSVLSRNLGLVISLCHILMKLYPHIWLTNGKMEKQCNRDWSQSFGAIVLSERKIPYLQMFDSPKLSGFSDASVDKESAWDVGNMDSILGLGRSLGGGNGIPLQYSCLKNPMNRGAWRASVQRSAKIWTQLSNKWMSKQTPAAAG